jgi:hypothetical protein
MQNKIINFIQDGLRGWDKVLFDIIFTKVKNNVFSIEKINEYDQYKVDPMSRTL